MIETLAAPTAPPPGILDVAARLRAIRCALEHLGLCTPVLAKSEERDEIALDEPWQPPAMDSLALATLHAKLQALTRDCEDALTLCFTVVPNLLVTSDISLAQVTALVSDARQLGSIRIMLVLDKGRLLARLGIQGGPYAEIFLFLFPEALTRVLGRPLPSLEEPGKLFDNPAGDRKRLILAVEGDVFLEGPYLAVAGGRFLPDWRSYLPAQAPDFALTRDLHSQAVQARSTLSWAGFSLGHLTPFYLQVHGQGVGPAGESIAQAVFRLRLALALTYTANQTKRIPLAPDQDPDQVDLIFTCYSERHLAEIRLGSPAAAASTEAFVAAVEDLTGLAEWAWEDCGSGAPSGRFGPDRLRMLRGVVAQALHGARPGDAWRRLLDISNSLVEDTQRSWQSFIEGKMDEYFERVKELEALVDSTVESFKAQVQSLVKGLTDNSLAAVAFVIGSLIASIFGGAFDPSVFRLGVLLYAAYLVVFPGYFGLTAAREQLQGTVERFNERVQSFRSRLSAEAVAGVIRQGRAIEPAVRQFEWWFATVRGVFIGTFILLILLAIFIPRLV